LFSCASVERAFHPSKYGTYFIGYCRTPRITEQMIENMFVGRPPGNYDRLLDFSHAVTGTLFFVPSATFLDSVTDAPRSHSAICASAGRNRSTPPNG
jgi:putative iron-dependent peroxidase